MQIRVKIIRMMMMMMIKKWYIIMFLYFFSMTAFSQPKDFGIWYGVSAEHKLKHKLEMNLSADVRTYENASKIEEGFLEGGLSYSVNKWVEVAGSYRLSKFIEENNSYYFRHKVFVDVKGNLPAGNFGFTCRLRFQTRTKTYIADDNDADTRYTGRIKLKVLYKTPSFPINPYLYSEAFCPLFSGKSGTIGKDRFAAGIEVSVIKHHSIEAEYIFQRDYQPHIKDMNIVSLNYNLKF
jgi:hypothetical protein